MQPHKNYHQLSYGNPAVIYRHILDVRHACDKIWHPGLIFKIKGIPSPSYFNLLNSYLNEGQCETKFNGETSSLFNINSGVPQGRFLGPLLYVLYTSDLTTSTETTLRIFANDTAIFATHEDPMVTSLNLQEHLQFTQKWLKKWKINVN